MRSSPTLTPRASTTLSARLRLAIEGDYDQCMEILKNCQLVGAEAGCKHVMTYAKINFKPEGDVMTTEHKVAKYHEGDPEFAPKSAGSAA